MLCEIERPSDDDWDSVVNEWKWWKKQPPSHCSLGLADERQQQKFQKMKTSLN